MYDIGTFRPQRRRALGHGIAAFLSALSLVGMSSLAMASEAPRGFGAPVGGGRVELPDSGFAVTFPHDWTVYEASPADEAVLTEDPLPDGQAIALDAFSADEDGMCEVILDDPTVRAEPSHLASYSRAGERDMSQMGVVGVTRDLVDLPVGPSWRLTGSWDGVPVSNYLVRGEKGLYTLYCFDTAGDPPEALWLSIASSFRFLPDPTNGELPPPLVRRGGRIAYPEAGFAITFPDAWTVERVDRATSRWLKRLVVPQEAARRTTLLWADRSTRAGCLPGRGRHPRCPGDIGDIDRRRHRVIPARHGAASRCGGVRE